MILIMISLIPLSFMIEMLEMSLNWKGYIFFIFTLLIFLYLTALAFSSKGLVKNGDRLYTAKFFKDFTLFKSKVGLNDRPVVSVLKFKKRQKYVWFSIAKPDLDKAFNSFEIFVLNERHIKRDSVMYFKSEESSQKAVEFLTTDFPLRHEVFSPNFN